MSHEGGDLAELHNEPKKDLFQLSVTPEKAPDKATYVQIGFKKGEPISIDGNKMGPVSIMKYLNDIGGKNAIGQIDIVENRLVGIKSRGVYETPGGTILYFAHDILEKLVLDKDTYHYKEIISKKYAELVYNGLWFSQLKEALDAFVEKTQMNLTGTVKIKLYKGNIILAGVKSDYSLYHKDLASFSDNISYDQKDAIGFIKLMGLPLKVYGEIKKKE